MLTALQAWTLSYDGISGVPMRRGEQTYPAELTAIAANVLLVARHATGAGADYGSTTVRVSLRESDDLGRCEAQEKQVEVGVLKGK